MGTEHITFSQPIVEELDLELTSTEGYVIRVVVMRDRQVLNLKFLGNIEPTADFTSMIFDDHPLPISFRPSKDTTVSIPLIIADAVSRGTLLIGKNGNLTISASQALNSPVGIPQTLATTLLGHDD